MPYVAREPTLRPPPKMPPERAEQFCIMLAIHFEVGNFELIRGVIDWAEREMAAGRAPWNADPTSLPLAMLEEIDFRTLNTLESHGLFTLGDLLACEKEELLAIEQIGEVAVRKLIAAARQRVTKAANHERRE